MIITAEGPKSNPAGQSRGRDSPHAQVMVTSDLQRTKSLEELAGHLRTGRLTPRIAGTYPIGRAGEAHARLEAGGVRGRLVLTF
jgi:NADPH:quinone reductase